MKIFTISQVVILKLLILGAGASKAYTQSKTKEKMPIACDFFDTFNKLEISSNQWVLISKISLYVLEKYGVDAFSYFASGIDIEEFHSSIECDLIEAISSKNHIESQFFQEAYNEIVYLFASVINEIQNGPVSKPHIQLANYLSKEDVIATFNWDTLIERALEEVHGWSSDFGYGFKPKSVYRNEWQTPNDKRKKSISLYKLHGSTNWLTVHPALLGNGITLGKNVNPDDVFVFESTVNPYSCHRGRYMEGYERYSYGYYPVNLDMTKSSPDGLILVRFNPPNPYIKQGESLSAGVETIPLIIPPVKEKKYDQFGNLFNRLWQKTANAIENADEIIFIGYSFPKTDIKSDQLFRSAFLKRKNKPKIKILDPYPERVVEKFKFEYGFLDSEVNVYKDYFSEQFDIEKMLSS